MRALGIERSQISFRYRYPAGRNSAVPAPEPLLTQPQLICADEPTGAFDSRSAQMLLDTFERMNRKWGDDLMVTHDAVFGGYCRPDPLFKDGQIFHELYRGQETRRVSESDPGMYWR